MGRAPCCDKANVKKGPWSPEEDATLKSYIEQHGTGGNWIALPQKIGLKRCGKSCRLRWLNYLRPNIKHGGFTEEEDRIICSLYVSIGSRWSIIAAQLPGRTDNDIKNYWNTRLKKKLFGRQRKEHKICRGNTSLKQEMSKRGSGNPMLQDNINSSHTITNNQTTYWPEFPVLAPFLYTNQEPNFSHHATSFSSFLNEVGVRFSDNEKPIQEGTNIQYPLDQMVSSTQQLCEQPPLLHATNNMGAQSLYMSSHEYYLGGADFSAEIEKISYNSNQQKFEGLGHMYEAVDMVNADRNAASSNETVNWCEMSTALVNPLTSNCGTSEQGMLQEAQFNELRYLGVQ